MLSLDICAKNMSNVGFDYNYHLLSSIYFGVVGSVCETIAGTSMQQPKLFVFKTNQTLKATLQSVSCQDCRINHKSSIFNRVNLIYFKLY
jgi:hypothetical protein